MHTKSPGARRPRSHVRSTALSASREETAGEGGVTTRARQVGEPFKDGMWLVTELVINALVEGNI